jgi:hypothetical protein
LEIFLGNFFWIFFRENVERSGATSEFVKVQVKVKVKVTLKAGCPDYIEGSKSNQASK